MKQQIKTSFEKYHAVMMKLDRITRNRSADNARHLPKLRMELATSALDMTRKIDQLEQQLSSPEQLALLDEFKSRYEKERKAIAEHQAKWSAPEMARNPQAFEQSAKAFFNLLMENHDWRMQTFLPQLA